MTRMLIVLAWLCVAASAHARAPRKIALHYTRADGASGCIDPVALARRVEAYTGPVLASPGQADVALEAHVEPDASGYTVRIRLAAPGSGEHGERTLRQEGKDCTPLGPTLAFVLATTIDPDLVLERVGALFQGGEQAADSELLRELEQHPPRPAYEPTQRVVVGPPRRLPVRHAPSFRPALAGGLALGNESMRVGLGMAGSARVIWRDWLALALAARFTVGASVIEERARATSFSFEPLVCARRGLARWLGAGLCVGPSLTMLRARGIALSEDEVGRNVVGGGALRLELSLELDARRRLLLAPFVTITAPQHDLVYALEGQRTVIEHTRRVALGMTLELLRLF